MLKLVAVSMLALACATNAMAGPLEDKNKKIVVDFYKLAFHQRQPTKAAEQYIGDIYIQHNPRVPNGAAAFYTYFEQYFKKNKATSAEIKRVVAEGDLVVLHVHSKMNPDDRGKAIVDIFRVADGKIVEHWDVIQDVPEGTANGNTMFEGSKAD